MRTHVTRLSLAAIAVLVVTLAAGVVAAAVTRSDVAYYDGFPDLSGLDMTHSQGVQIDALGGLRMATIGKATAATWTSTADFTAPAAPLGPVVGMSTLDASTLAGTLRLPTAPFVLTVMIAAVSTSKPIMPRPMRAIASAVRSSFVTVSAA